jgi:hypothetical protein
MQGIRRKHFPEVEGGYPLSCSGEAFVGCRRSISSMIRSAQRIESAMAQIVAATRFPGSYCASFRVERIAAAISQHALAILVQQLLIMRRAFGRFYGHSLRGDRTE